jgi:hypothetical protein
VLHSDEVREKMKSRYLSNPDYNFEKVNRASMACGPMVKWAIAQVIEDCITVSFIFSKVASCLRSDNEKIAVNILIEIFLN